MNEQKYKQEDLYVGKQVIIDSDRLVFNGREDTTFSSKKRFLFKTDGDFHINTSEDVKINTPRIYLGPTIDKKDPDDSAVKFSALKELLKKLLDDLEDFFIHQYPKTSGLQGPNPAVNVQLTGPIIEGLKTTKGMIDNIKSEYVKIR